MAQNIVDFRMAEWLKINPEQVKTVKDVSPEAFIKAFALHLKRQGKLEIPKWADYVKTSYSRELPPISQDWLYIRCASVARQVYIRQGTGVGALRKAYGAKERRGVCTNKHSKASGKIVRYCMQQLTEMGLVEESANGGRRITQDGQRELDTVAVQVAALADEE